MLTLVTDLPKLVYCRKNDVYTEFEIHYKTGIPHRAILNTDVVEMLDRVASVSQRFDCTVTVSLGLRMIGHACQYLASCGTIIIVE